MRSLVSGLVLISALLSGPAKAIDGVSLETGVGKYIGMERVAVQWQSDRQWHRGDTSQVSMYWELALGQWHWDEAFPGRDYYIAEVGLTPIFRWHNNSKRGLYAEAGVGAHWLSGTRLGVRMLSTSYQFGTLLGVGYRFGARGEYDVSLRVQHLSNASIKLPNDGINFSQLHLQYWY